MVKQILNAGKTLIGDAYDYWLTGQYKKQHGQIEEHFAKRSEERADARNRQLLIDQPGLTALGRARAGLNIAGEGSLPGMTAQSNVDTSSAPDGTFSQRQAVLQQMRVQEQQLRNETIVAESQANKNNAEADAARGGEKRAQERFPVEMYGLQLSNELNAFEYDQAKQKAPYILKQLENDIEYQEWQIINASKDAELKDATLQEKRETILNLQTTRGLIKAQEILAFSNVSLNEEQKELFKVQTGLVNAQKEYTRLECKDLYETITNNLKNGVYENLSKSTSQRLSYELERSARTLWDKPDDASTWWYLGNFFWNIQNCLTLSGSASASSGARVVTKK